MTTSATLVEPARPADADDLASLAQATAQAWTRAHFEAALGTAGTSVFVVRASPAGAPCALCVLARVADEAEIHALAVAPDERRRGLARALLGHALEHAARAGARAAFLEVRASNVAARALYAGLGFVESGLRRAYYSAPAEDALLLRRILEFPEGAC